MNFVLLTNVNTKYTFASKKYYFKCSVCEFPISLTSILEFMQIRLLIR